MFTPHKQAYGIGTEGIIAVWGFVLGPFVGGFAAQMEGWSWQVWELTWLCVIILNVPVFSAGDVGAQIACTEERY